jgi:hypothetical protein
MQVTVWLAGGASNVLETVGSDKDHAAIAVSVLGRALVASLVLLCDGKGHWARLINADFLNAVLILLVRASNVFVGVVIVDFAQLQSLEVLLEIFEAHPEGAIISGDETNLLLELRRPGV